MRKLIVLGLLLSLQLAAWAQFNTVKVNGQIVKIMIDEQGDTLFLSTLDDMSISSPREFASREEYLRYRRYQIYAAKVYPYAREAIRIFTEVEEQADGMKNRKRKKFMKQKTEELKTEFEAPLRKLTKTQGKILVKMIERELDTPMYRLIKNLRGTFTAAYWNTFSKFYGHRLKDGYVRGEDHILDAVLDDLELSD
ncbi:MAG: DUF4294 domain-containing protein [Bacteroidota bacterium]